MIFLESLEKVLKHGTILTGLEDILFWIIVGTIVLFSIFKFNNGVIRGFMFFGITLGIFFYILTFSKVIINLSVKIINFIKNMVEKIIKIIFRPLKIIFKMLRKIILKPVTFIFINIKNNSKITKIKENTNEDIGNNRI